MFETFRNAWKLVDLRKKILFTLFIIVIFRIGSAIPVPFIDPAALAQSVQTASSEGSILGYLDVLTGGAFSKATLFALSISPYITSSIVVQLLTIAIPALERLAKEGEDGRKKIQKITRYVTLVLAVLQAYAYFTLQRAEGAIKYTRGFAGFFAAATIIMTFTAGALLIVWIGERINDKGIGNGISMILFAGIVSRGPSAVFYLVESLKLRPINYLWVPVIAVIFVLIIAFIVLMTQAERKIPVQYAKRVVGRKMYGGQSSHIPIKVNMSGVMPIIFASSIMSIPGTIKGFANPAPGSFWDNALGLFNFNTWLYAVLYFVLIIAFNYFYVSMQYNPIEIANNLRKQSGAIPGIRPGKPTSDFIVRVLSKITFIGAFFLAFIAILPIGIGAITKLNIALGGTTILIVVGVALETVRQLESQMMMRHYKGFLE